MRSAAFLDRDGVLNKTILQNGCLRSPRFLKEFELLPGTAKGVKMLQNAGLLVIVVTNQPELARGLLGPIELARMHRHLRELAAVDAIYVCPHDDRDGCACRKPKPGLLLEASADWGVALGTCFVVGDSWKDIEAGIAAGCQTFLVESALPQQHRAQPSYRVRDLGAAARIIATLARSGQELPRISTGTST